jgi:hypothetical protein
MRTGTMVALIVAVLVIVAWVVVTCTHSDSTAPTISPTPTPTETNPPRPSPSPPLGPEDVAKWVAIWKPAFQRFADDLGGVIQSVRNRDLNALQATLARLPGDANDVLQKMNDAGRAPPGFREEARRLRSLIHRVQVNGSKLGADCLSNPGLPCAADVAQLADVAGRILDALKPFGVGVNFQIEI